jgi:hypothetical protein
LECVKGKGSISNKWEDDTSFEYLLIDR